MRDIAFLFVSAVALSSVAAFMAPHFGQVDDEAAATERQPQAVAEPITSVWREETR